MRISKSYLVIISLNMQWHQQIMLLSLLEEGPIAAVWISLQSFKTINGLDTEVLKQHVPYMDLSQAPTRLWLLVIILPLRKYRLSLQIQLWITLLYFIHRDVPTEVWNFNNGDNKLIQPTLPGSKYCLGIGLYLVDANFCKKEWM